MLSQFLPTERYLVAEALLQDVSKGSGVTEEKTIMADRGESRKMGVANIHDTFSCNVHTCTVGASLRGLKCRSHLCVVQKSSLPFMSLFLFEIIQLLLSLLHSTVES